MNAICLNKSQFTHLQERYTHTLHHGIGFSVHTACVSAAVSAGIFFCRRRFLASLSNRLHDWPYCFQMLAKWSQRIFAYFYIQTNLFDTCLCVYVVCVRAGISLARSPYSALVSLRLCAHVGEKEQIDEKNHWIAKRISYAHLNTLQITAQCCARHTFVHSNSICYIQNVQHSIVPRIDWPHSVYRCKVWMLLQEKQMIKFPNRSSK